MANFFDKKFDNYKGPITEFIIGKDGKHHPSPILNVLKTANVTSNMFHVPQIQERDGGDYYRDVWIVLTNHHNNTHEKLKELSKFKGTKCCWKDKDPKKSLEHFFTGIGRMVEYADFEDGGASPAYAYKIVEG